MRVEIRRRCSSKYTLLLRIYGGMAAAVTLCASVALGIMELPGYAVLTGGLCAVMCCAAVCVPLSFGRISYIRSGGCLRVEKGWLVRRTLIINRSEIRSSEIRGGPLQRKLGLCCVKFSTGSGSVTLRGVVLRDGELLNRALGGEAGV